MAGRYNYNRRRGRPTKREEIAQKNAAHRAWGVMFDKPEVAEQFCKPLPPERAPRQPSGKPLEKHVLASVIDALRRDPRVALVGRQQSGVFQDGDRWIRVGTPGALDIAGMLVGGKHFEIETKRPGGKPDERQQNRIDAIRANGGIAGCATCVEEALALLP